MAADRYIITACNTVNLAAGVPLRLIVAVPGRYRVNILNLGPGTLYYRFDGDPAVNDAASVTLLVNTSDNEIQVDGTRGIGVISDQNSKISIRGEIV